VPRTKTIHTTETVEEVDPVTGEVREVEKPKTFTYRWFILQRIAFESRHTEWKPLPEMPYHEVRDGSLTEEEFKDVLQFIEEDDAVTSVTFKSLGSVDATFSNDLHSRLIRS